MYYRGSCRKLLRNSRSALLAAVEIYNKPNFQYRDECFVILLLNAWELALKALISKNKGSIFYPKKRNQMQHKTLSLGDAFDKAEPFLRKVLEPLPIRRNLDMLQTYRDNAVHFYNEKDFGILIHALAQTAVHNFRDLLVKSFSTTLHGESNWHLMPIGLEPPIDALTYLKGAAPGKNTGGAVKQFLAALSRSINEVEGAGADLGRLLTIYQVNFQSTKKVGVADLVVGVKNADEAGLIVVTKSQNPNETHPLKRKDLMNKVKTVGSVPLNDHVLNALCRTFNLVERRDLYWRSTNGELTKYADAAIPWLEGLTTDQVQFALNQYKAFLRTRWVPRTGKKGRAAQTKLLV